jgi:calcium-dependent protein kinase
MAPEVIANDVDYDERCDAWGVGVLAYFVLTGRLPFRGKMRSQIFENVQQQVLPCEPLLQSPACSPAARDFVESLLVKDPAGRMTVDEALRHDWMTETFVKTA